MADNKHIVRTSPEVRLLGTYYHGAFEAGCLEAAADGCDRTEVGARRLSEEEGCLFGVRMEQTSGYTGFPVTYTPLPGTKVGILREEANVAVVSPEAAADFVKNWKPGLLERLTIGGSGTRYDIVARSGAGDPWAVVLPSRLEGRILALMPALNATPTTPAVDFPTA